VHPGTRFAIPSSTGSCPTSWGPDVSFAADGTRHFLPTFDPMWSVGAQGNVLVAAGAGYIDEWRAVYVATLGP